MRFFFAVAAAVVVTAWSPMSLAQGAAETIACPSGAAPGVTDQRLTSGERARAYRLFVPSTYDGRTPLPLVLDLHGNGSTLLAQVDASRFEILAEQEGFLVATLEAYENNRWNVPVVEDRADDVAYVSDVIDHVAARACTDLARVYAAGFSGGARMSSLLACRLGGRIAAIGPMAGLRWPGPCDGRAVPVLTFHGLADTANTYEGRMERRGAEWLESVPEALAGWASHNGCDPNVIFEDPPGPLSTMRYARCNDNAEVRLVRIDDMGHVWAREPVDATAAMWEFFTQHSLPR